METRETRDSVGAMGHESSTGQSRTLGYSAQSRLVDAFQAGTKSAHSNTTGLYQVCSVPGACTKVRTCGLFI